MARIKSPQTDANCGRRGPAPEPRNHLNYQAFFKSMLPWTCVRQLHNEDSLFCKRSSICWTRCTFLWDLSSSFLQASWNGISGPSWWWWPSASQEDWSSCTSSVKSTSIYGGDSKPITGSYTSRTGRTRIKSWRWRSRPSWSQTWSARRLWPPPSRTQTPPSTQRQRTTVWRCSTSNCSAAGHRLRFPVHTIHAVRSSVKDSRRGNAGWGTNRTPPFL